VDAAAEVPAVAAEVPAVAAEVPAVAAEVPAVAAEVPAVAAEVPVPTAADAAVTAMRLLIARGLTVGTAESLTGGLVAAALTSVPGASAAFRGGIVAYAADVKASMLGVPGDLLDRVGTVHRDVALAMARGARDRLGAVFGVATTGVAGPDPADGQPVGTVHVAVSTRADDLHLALHLAGDRDQIRAETVSQVLILLISALAEDNQ
jgi:nicotinamide-nucleotide amidase